MLAPLHNGLITGNEGMAYRREVTWCDNDSFSLSADNTKEMTMDMKREEAPTTSDNLLRRLRKFWMLLRIFISFFSCITEIILTSCVTECYGNSTATDPQTLADSGKDCWEDCQGTLSAGYLSGDRYPQSLHHHQRLYLHSKHIFTPMSLGRRHTSANCSFYVKVIRLINRYFFFFLILPNILSFVFFIFIFFVPVNYVSLINVIQSRRQRKSRESCFSIWQ